MVTKNILYTLIVISSTSFGMDKRKLVKRAAIEGDLKKLEYALKERQQEITLTKGLVKAIYNGRPEIAQKLIEAGASVKNYSWKRSAQGTYQLLWDVFNAHQVNHLPLVDAEKLISLMVEQSNIDVNEKDINGVTPLLKAARLKSKSMVSSLLIHGALMENLKYDQDALNFAVSVHDSMN